MNIFLLVAGILPIILFAIVDAFSTMNKALITACIVAILEAGFSYYYFGELDQVTLFSFFLVIVMAILSFFQKKALFFKLQPVILSTLIGGYFFSSFFFQDPPVLLALIQKYGSKLPREMHLFLNPEFEGMFSYATLYISIASFMHALVTWIAAIKLSTKWWVIIRIFAYYGFMFAAVFMSQFHINMR